MSNEYVRFKFKFLNKVKYLNELTLLENKNKIYLLFILLIKINKESKYIICSIQKQFTISKHEKLINDLNINSIIFLLIKNDIYQKILNNL
jgi:hypothetical protein